MVLAELDFGELAEHISDSKYFHFPGWKPELWKPFGFQLSKYMVLELVAAGLMLLVFLALARSIRGGAAPKGRFWNFFEVLLLFIRDEVARPAIGKHDADKFLPFLWNIFFFILFCNLLGILPWAGSPTGALMVTAALAAITFCAVVGIGVQKFGVGGFFKSLVPHMELPKAIAVILIPMVFVIELVGLLIRHVVLAVRLLANMFAGHLVLAVILGFIAVWANPFSFAWVGITTASVLGSAALTLLELFVAFLQAYIFTFLSAIFIGMAVHPH
jgi:F-type H+-transporting ATPase subunit a